MRLRLHPREEPALAREALRLKLIAAATELSVVCELTLHALSRIGDRKAEHPLVPACREHRDAALQLLSPETGFDALPDEELRQMLGVFEDRLAQARGVRQQAEQLVLSLRHPRRMLSVTWWPGEPDAGPSILAPQGWWPRRFRRTMNPVPPAGEAARRSL